MRCCARWSAPSAARRAITSADVDVWSRSRISIDCSCAAVARERDGRRRVRLHHRADGVRQDRPRVGARGAHPARGRQHGFRDGLSRPRHRYGETFGGDPSRGAAPPRRHPRAHGVVLGGTLRTGRRARDRRDPRARPTAAAGRRHVAAICALCATASRRCRAPIRPSVPSSIAKRQNLAGTHCTSACGAWTRPRPRGSRRATGSASSERWRCMR